MANVLNITASNLGNDIGKRFLGDVTVSIRLHGDSASTFYPIGYMNPEKAFKSNREYSEFEVGMPITVAARDLKKASYSFSGKIKQFQAETFALVLGAYLDNTTPTAPRVILGSSLPEPLECSMILSGETKDGKALDLYIRKALITSETVEIALGSQEYGELQFDATVCIDDYPLETNWSWEMKGVVETTVSSLAAGDDMTVASATGISTGMKCYTEASGFLGYVSEIASSVVTLDRSWTETGTTVAVKFVSVANEEMDNIAYFEFEVDAA